jgi:hypothetical protein
MNLIKISRDLPAVEMGRMVVRERGGGRKTKTVGWVEYKVMRKKYI